MNYILYFLIYSVLGWALETLFALVFEHRFAVRRTMLKSPMCPVYGLGAVLLLLTLKPVSDSTLILFSGGFLVASSAEYLVASYSEHYLGVRLWDYRKSKTNLSGRVCAPFSLCWGLCAIIFFRFLEPAVTQLVEATDASLRLFCTVIWGCYFLVDLKNTLSEMRRYGAGENDSIITALPFLKRL